MRICLLALTGFGNTILEELVRIEAVEEILVFTRKEQGEYPYYKCENLSEYCKKKIVTYYEDLKLTDQQTYEVFTKINPDLILVATFNQKIPPEIIKMPRKGTINIHPSYLPYYRGATPSHWAIVNGEKESGVTYHFISEEFDMGDILFQRKVPIEGITDGELRKELANVAGEMLPDFLSQYMSGKLVPRAQRKDEGSSFPKFTSKEGIALLKSGKFKEDNILRGLKPYPGKRILQ